MSYQLGSKGSEQLKKPTTQELVSEPSVSRPVIVVVVVVVKHFSRDLTRPASCPTKFVPEKVVKGAQLKRLEKKSSRTRLYNTIHVLLNINKSV